MRNFSRAGQLSRFFTQTTSTARASGMRRIIPQTDIRAQNPTHLALGTQSGTIAPARLVQIAHPQQSPQRILANSSFRSLLELTNLDVILYISAPMAALVAFIFYLNPPRETPVTHSKIDISSENRKEFMVDSSKFKRVGDKPKGELSGEIVEDELGNRYLKKGAQHLNGLLQEFLISEFLSMIYPGVQPDSLIMQEIQADDTARFYTLSRMFPNSMDLEEFVRQGDWKEKLANKPLKNFDVALAADFALGKARDMKLANYIIIEKDDGYYVATIDHEYAGDSYFGFYQPICTTDITKLCRGVNDIYPPDEYNKSGLAGDPRAVEFMQEASKFMDEKNVLAFYQKIVDANTTHITALISSIDGTGGLLTALETHPYFNQLATLQERARKFLYSHAVAEAVKAEAANSPEATGPSI